MSLLRVGEYHLKCCSFNMLSFNRLWSSCKLCKAASFFVEGYIGSSTIKQVQQYTFFNFKYNGIYWDS